MKKLGESRSRGWRAFWLDGCKQGLGHLLVHAVNVRDSARMRLASRGACDECALYLAIFALDMGLGLPLLCLLSSSAQSLLRLLGLRRMLNGSYARCAALDLPGYLGQVGVWLALELLAKAAVSALHAQVVAPLALHLQAVLAVAAPHRRERETLSLVVLPLSMNMICMWVTDGLLKGDAAEDPQAYFAEGLLHADLHSASTNSSLGSVRARCLSKRSIASG